MSSYVTDRSRLTARERFVLLENGEAEHENRLTTVEDKVDTHDTKLTALAVKLGFFATGGSLVGGGIVAAVLYALFHPH